MFTVVSGQPIGLIFNGQDGCPRTSVNYKHTLRNNPESEELIYNVGDARNLASYKII
jgi:hypothetical protein